SVVLLVFRDAPPGCKFFSVKCSRNVLYTITPTPNETSHSSPMPLSGNTVLHISTKPNFHFDLNYKEEVICTALSLDVDADRDGVVEKNNPNKASWKWGPDGHGAVVLVNCDRERYVYYRKPDFCDRESKTKLTLKDCATMLLRINGPELLVAGYKLVMHISERDSEYIRRSLKNTYCSFKSLDRQRKYIYDYPLVLSSEVLSQELPQLERAPQLKFYVEGLRFPDKDFDGLVTINLTYSSPFFSFFKDGPDMPVFTDKVVFRVSPWIMTPNTLEPEEVFVCSTSDNAFLKEIKDLVDRSGHQLKTVEKRKNRGDRWIQEEIELGYVDSPYHRFPVVLDSPRDEKPDDYPYHGIGPDFGYVKRDADRDAVSSLDSFCNLKVSPPVTVNGKKYPLGRMLIGVAFPKTTNGRNMTQVVQDFLWAQKVQEPVALYADWLVISHIDQFMTFVPAPDRKRKYKLLHTQKSCTDVLKKELGLDEEDIIDLPILFKLVTKDNDERAVAYYPNMRSLNMIFSFSYISNIELPLSVMLEPLATNRPVEIKYSKVVYPSHYCLLCMSLWTKVSVKKRKRNIYIYIYICHSFKM
uniref:Peptidyl arginine deiminase, type II n=1 Tax=Cyprinodon variegatus TaxID=28743 RepID=A0A3Q2GPP6_CYPVA